MLFHESTSTNTYSPNYGKNKKEDPTDMISIPTTMLSMYTN